MKNLYDVYIEKMTTNLTTNRYFKVSVWADSDKEANELVKKLVD